MINCDFDYCIYNNNLVCVLDEIELGDIGQCISCIMISLPERGLQELKKNQLQELEKRFGRSNY